MDTSDIPEEVNRGHRRFLGAAALAVGASQLGRTGPDKAQTSGAIPGSRATARPETVTPFGPVRQINAGVLNVGYVETGPPGGHAVILLHGFPYDIHSYVEVAPLLAARGYRVIVPYMRGHGTTTFLSRTTPRTGEQAAMAVDNLALMDALKIDSAILAGYDLGSRSGDIIAALWPDRVRALVSATGYLITNLAANRRPLPPKAEWAWWYQYYFSTERGVLGLAEYRHDLGELIWKFNSPTWHFSEETYNQTAAAFNNPDYVSVIINNYRYRLSLVPGQPQYAEIENQLQKAPVISVPTITIDGEYDPFTAPGNGAAYRDKFTGKYDHRVLKVGHNVPQEAPRAFAQAIVDVSHF